MISNSAMARFLNFEVLLAFIFLSSVCREKVYIEPPERGIDPKWIIMSIVLMILLVGLLCIMLARLCIYFQDSYEYAKFKKETVNSEWKMVSTYLYGCLDLI